MRLDTHGNPWIMGAKLTIHGADRQVVYMVHGGCGPRVPAYLCRWPE